MAKKNNETGGRKMTRKEKSLINKAKWRANQRVRYFRMRKRKEYLKQKKLAGDVKGTFKVVITVNRKLYKTIHYGHWSIAANERYNKALEENRESVKFPMECVTTGKHLKPYISEILLIRKIDGTFDPSMKAPIRDDDGRILDLVIADREDYVITRRDIWYTEEKFSMSGPHPFRQRKNYSYLVSMLKDMEGMFRMMRLGIRLIFLTDDEGLEYVRCKSVPDCERLYEALCNENELDGRLIPLGQAMGENVKWLADMLVEKTGRPRRAFLKNGYQNEHPRP